jgi:hypothetical protein
MNGGCSIHLQTFSSYMKNIIFYIILGSFLVNNIKMAGMETQKKGSFAGGKTTRD